jgi:hypothetical protein
MCFSFHHSTDERRRSKSTGRPKKAKRADRLANIGALQVSPALMNVDNKLDANIGC